jgi:hypothetical protein
MSECYHAVISSAHKLLTSKKRCIFISSLYIRLLYKCPFYRVPDQGIYYCIYPNDVLQNPSWEALMYVYEQYLCI